MDARWKILLVVDTLDIGGAERHVVALARGMAGRGHDVTIACATAGLAGEELAGSGVRVVAVLGSRVKRQHSPAFVSELRGLLWARRYDIVHAHMFAAQVAAADALASSGPPLVLTEHSEGAWQDVAARRLSRTAHAAATRSIAVSAGVGRRLQLELHVPPARIAVIPNALPPLRKEDHVPFPGLHADRPHVGVVARLVPEKGVDLFLDAVALAIRQGVRASFVIAGDGPERGRLEVQAARLGIAGRVSFLGVVPNARPLIEALDLLVVPSRTEGTPLVVLEALALGTPVVASAVGGIPEQLAGRGCLISPGDVDDLAAVLAQSDRTRDDHHATSADRIDALYDTWLDSVLEQYERALEDHARHQTAGRASHYPVSLARLM